MYLLSKVRNQIQDKETDNIFNDTLHESYAIKGLHIDEGCHNTRSTDKVLICVIYIFFYPARAFLISMYLITHDGYTE